MPSTAVQGCRAAQYGTTAEVQLANGHSTSPNPAVYHLQAYHSVTSFYLPCVHYVHKEW